jgi:hypothetical protein
MEKKELIPQERQMDQVVYRFPLIRASMTGFVPVCSW